MQDADDVFLPAEMHSVPLRVLEVHSAAPDCKSQTCKLPTLVRPSGRQCRLCAIAELFLG